MTSTGQRPPDQAGVEPTSGRARQPNVVALLLLGGAFAALLVGVLTRGAVVTVDLQVRAWVLAHHPHRAVVLSTTITALADPKISVAALMLVATRLSRRRRSTAPLVLAGLGAAGLTTSVVALKALVHRPGPALVRGHVPTGYFPSGHTTSALLCYGLIAVLLTYRAPSWRYAPAFRAGFVAAAPVGAAMVYSNFHWLSDVLAGGALGGTLLWVAVATAARLPGSAAPLGRRAQDQGVDASGSTPMPSTDQ